MRTDSEKQRERRVKPRMHASWLASAVTITIAYGVGPYGASHFGDVRPDAPALRPLDSSSSERSIERGLVLFHKVWTKQDGLGPEMNARSCDACHATPRVGGAGTDRASFVSLSFDVTDPSGGHLFRQFYFKSSDRIARRVPPSNAVIRKAPSLFGARLLELVPDEAIRAFADPDDQDHDGITGRIAMTRDGIGRFGWKARFARVDHAVAVALLNELGLTTTRYPGETALERDTRATAEVLDSDFKSLVEFVRSLPPLPALQMDPDVLHRGEDVFGRIGCSSCHHPTFHVDPTPGAVNEKTAIHPYTDLLLHDMGPALGDGITEGNAAGREFRTAPLWGASRTGPPYLHDGRAGTLSEAIRAHGGEAKRSADAYRNLTERDCEALLEFVQSR